MDTRTPKQADGNNSRQLSLSPPVWICPPHLLGHHPMVTLLLDRSKVIVWLMKDGNEQNLLNPPQQDSPVPCVPFQQTLQQPTPGVIGTQLLEYFFRTCTTTPCSVIIINDTPVGSPSPDSPSLTPPPSPRVTPPSAPKNLSTSSPQCRAPLIPTMMLARNLPTYNQLE
ncbi:hypothetical protein O181_077614 [Austropuccinia psidii MF-1]|uniref:Uncharacterized protein n=1 Tax=Austropuccinia psidii MF-1 TaxID=1389203 RepID=A0A9Q3FEU4_9BASI|nr:hypothetical protein [Austropuccinia psidii MF-1]